MAWIAVAIAGAAVVGAGASIASSSSASRASRQAADAQAGASDRATQSQLDMFYQNREDMAPWRDVGQEGLYSLADLMGIQPRVPVQTDTGMPGAGVNPYAKTLTMNPTTAPDGSTAYEYRPKSGNFGMLTQPFSYNDFYQDPGYAFRLAEGNKAIDRASAARGGFFSGRAGKELARYGQDYASNEYGNAYNRYNQDQNTLYNRYAGLSGTGQTATSQIGQYGQNAANQIGQNALYTGNAQAQGYLGAGQARASGYAGVANAATSGAQNYLFMNAMNKPIGRQFNPYGQSTGAWDTGGY